MLSIKHLRGVTHDRKVRRKLRGHFSESFYLSQFSNSEKESIKDPLDHFLTFWRTNGFDPNPFFSMKRYLEANPDVAADGQNPLVHFITNGIFEKRNLFASESKTESTALQVVYLEKKLDEVVLKSIENVNKLHDYLLNLEIMTENTSDLGQVDSDYYLTQFADCSIENSQQHFDEIGWKIGLNPNTWFNTNAYLRIYEDVKAAQINPFTHFVQQGHLEHRIPNHENLRNFFSVLEGKSLENESVAWLNSTANFALNDIPSFRRHIRKHGFQNSQLVISIGHSQYLRDTGGIQLYTFLEAKKFNELKINYLHLSPSKPLPSLADKELKDLCCKITFNNIEQEGDYLLSELLSEIGTINDEFNITAVIVNSLYGWNPEQLMAAFDALPADDFYWVFHDYSVFCENSNLNYEKIKSCHNPSSDSGLCSTCRFGKKRSEYLERISKLLYSRRWKMISPSDSCSQNVSKYLGVDISSIRTVPHLTLKERIGNRDFCAKPRVAFVGHPAVHKGWLNYLNFRDRNLKHFDFYHFGLIDMSESGISYFKLENDYTNLNASRDLLISHQIDAVFICPTWHETFCFVAYEAIAAGCLVICNSQSGNVADAAGAAAIFYDPSFPPHTQEILNEVVAAREKTRKVQDFIYTGTVASVFQS